MGIKDMHLKFLIDVQKKKSVWRLDMMGNRLLGKRRNNQRRFKLIDLGLIETEKMVELVKKKKKLGNESK